MFEKLVVVDGRGHLLGRLAAVVARELIRGQKVVVVRCEEINMSGSLARNEVKFHAYLNLVTRTNPRRGHFHYRTPARIMWKAVRGMLSHKTPHGAAAFGRLKVFEGVPPPYDTMKRMVVPAALRVRLAPGRKYCVLKDLCQKVGWKYNAVVEKLEEKRKVKSHAFYVNKKKKVAKKAVAMKSEKLTKVNAELAKYGY